jgi:predicted neutral ceramidase superfamily lipid hydrolase
MAFFVCLQLSSFVLLTAMSLWINTLMNSVIAVLFAKTRANLGLFITNAIVSPAFHLLVKILTV